MDYVQRGFKKNRYVVSCFMVLLGGVVPGQSRAVTSPDDTIRPYVASNLLYDNNFLRISDSVDPVAASGKRDKSEFVKQVKAGFDMDWTLSRQHFVVKANVNQNWFQNFTSLDYTGWDTRAQWNWQLLNNWNGEIGYANVETLGDFAQLNQLIDNLQNNQRYFANGGYLFHPNGKIKAGVFRTEIQYDQNGRQVSNNTEDNAEVNLQYLSPTGSIFGVRVLATDGQYPLRQLTATSTQDNAYTRMNYAATWDWRYSSKTRIDGLVGYTQQNYRHFGERNFADVIAQLNLSWQASDKTLVELSARRLIAQANNRFASFVLTQGIWMDLTWQATQKIALKLPVSYQQQDYLGGGGGTTVGVVQQKDNVGNVGLNLTYKALESVNLGALLNYEKRDSNDPLRAYESKSAGGNIQVVF